MAKDWSNLKNQPKKVDDKEETKKIDESEEEAKADSEDEAEEVVETKEEKKARIAEEKAKAKAEKEAKADADEAVELDEKIYFVHSDKKYNLNTNVGSFHEGLFVANTEAEAECIRKTEDFQWGLTKEMSAKEYADSRKTK